MQTVAQEASTLQAPLATALRARGNRRTATEAFFLEHLEERFGTMELHQRFGTGFRGRKSDINDDPKSRITIFNETTAGQDEHGEPCERSVYWAELRGAGESHQPGESEYMRRARQEQQRELKRVAPLFAVARP